MSTEYDVKQITGIVYDPDNDLRLDLYLPVGPTRPPVAVYLHGGAWLMGERAESVDRLTGLAAQGVAVASIDYRTVNITSYPAQHDDIVRALAWVRANADDYGLDDGPAVLMGSSAGAHLAALTTFRFADAVEVAALVGLFGRYNLLPGAPKALSGLEIPAVIRSSTPPAGFEGVDQRGKLALLAGTTPADLDDAQLQQLSPLHHASDRAPRGSSSCTAPGTRSSITGIASTWRSGSPTRARPGRST